MKKTKLKVTLFRSPIGEPAKIKANVAGLGLKRPNRSVTLPDTPQVRGMLAKVSHMVVWSVIEEAAKKTRKKTAAEG